MWDLVSWPRIKPRPPALGEQSLSHRTTQGSPQKKYLNMETNSPTKARRKAGPLINFLLQKPPSQVPELWNQTHVSPSRNPGGFFSQKHKFFYRRKDLEKLKYGNPSTKSISPPAPLTYTVSSQSSGASLFVNSEPGMAKFMRTASNRQDGGSKRNF